MVRTFPLSLVSARSMVLGPGAKLLGVLSRDEWSVWNLDAERRDVTIPMSWGRESLDFEGLTASLNGNYFVAARGRRLMILDLRARTVAEADVGQRVAGIGVSPDGSIVGVLVESSRLYLFQREDDRFVLYLALDVPFPFGHPFAFSQDGRSLALASAGSGLQFDIIDVASRRLIHGLRHPGMWPMHLAFSRDGSNLIAIAFLEKPFVGLVWDLRSRSPEYKHRLQLDGPEDGLHDQALSPHGECWAGIREQDNAIQLQLIPSGERIAVGSNLARKTCFSVDGDYLAALDTNDHLHLWELDAIVSSGAID